MINGLLMLLINEVYLRHEPREALLVVPLPSMNRMAAEEKGELQRVIPTPLYRQHTNRDNIMVY